MNLLRNLSLSIFLFTGITPIAHADNFKVYQPQVTQGEFALEGNFNFSNDHRHDQDRYFSEVLGFEYGFTNYYKMELSGEFEKNNGENNQLTNIKWENIFVPFQHGEQWIDSGLYLELEKSKHSEDPNNFEAKILLEKEFGKWDNTANLIVSHEFGPHYSHDLNTGLAWQTKYRLNKMFEPGFEYYADFGAINHTQSFNEEDHRIGPVVEGKFGKMLYSTGVLVGVSNSASDITYKLNLEYEF